MTVMRRRRRSTMSFSIVSVWLWIVWSGGWPMACCAFVAPSWTSARTTSARWSSLTTTNRNSQRRSFVVLGLSSSSSASDPAATDATTANKINNNNNSIHHHPLLKDCTIHEIVMKDVVGTLGCTVEESLADPGMVLVTFVLEEGSAQRAGLQVGDVLLQINSGLFGALEGVRGMEQVQTLVHSRTNSEPLIWTVARGSAVLTRHESQLTELCANPDTSDQEAEQCVLEFLQGGYMDDNSEEPQTAIVGDDHPCDMDDDDCLLDSVLDLWADDVVTTPLESVSETDNNDVPSSSTTKPWSSRASPSGTFVRDPETGQMRNID